MMCSILLLDNEQAPKEGLDYQLLEPAFILCYFYSVQILRETGGQQRTCRGHAAE